MHFQWILFHNNAKQTVQGILHLMPWRQNLLLATCVRIPTRPFLCIHNYIAYDYNRYTSSMAKLVCLPPETRQ